MAQATNFIRSATAPEMSAGVITANIPRNAIVTSRRRAVRREVDAVEHEGVESPEPGCVEVTAPMEYPTITHRSGMVRRHQKFIINMLRTFRCRSMPP